MYYVPLAVQCIYGCSDEGGEDGNEKKGSELPERWERVEIALVLCGESEKDLRAMVTVC